MTWFKIDDAFHSHPKTTATSLAALGLWTVAGTWSGDHLTDGFVPDHMIPLLSRGASQLAEELSAKGLWRRVRGGYRFHDWESYQPSRERVTKDRKAAAERQAAYRDRLKKGRSEPSASRRDSPVNHRVSDSAPTRPDPLPPEERVGGAAAAPAATPPDRQPSVRRCPDCGNAVDSAYHLGACRRFASFSDRPEGAP